MKMMIGACSLDFRCYPWIEVRHVKNKVLFVGEEASFVASDVGRDVMNRVLEYCWVPSSPAPIENPLRGGREGSILFFSL